MKWRDHKRLAYQLAKTFNLDGTALAEGSVEPDRKRTVVHTWSKARRSARAALYRARKAFLRGKMKKCARWIGVCSHFIEDGMIHGTMDNYSYGDDHSALEGQIGQRVKITVLNRIDNQEEGLVDGEFVFREIDALVSEGLDAERLGQALSLLGSSVLGDPQASAELVKNRARFLERIKKIDLKIMAGAALLLVAAGGLLSRDPLWLLLLPFGALYFGRASVFRFLRLYGWLLPGAAVLALLADLEMGQVAIAAIAMLGIFYLQPIPDLTRLSEKWFRLPPPSRGKTGGESLT